jgi:eukaryotic-like serine/threonine-protein kinase
VGCDLYLLGNLAAFLFSGVNITSAIFARLDPQFLPQNWAGTYDDVLPHIRRAFHDVITDLSAAIDPLVRDDIIVLIKELCNPELAKRGHRKGLGSGSQYSLERYKSQTDLMLKRASASIRARKSA